MSEIIKKTMDYDGMVDLFVRSGLEISPDEPAPKGLLTCFELTDEVTKERLGAGGLVRENGEYILRCVAVEEAHRGKNFGKRLVEAILEEAVNHGAKRIWLTAKVPDFYKKFGFIVVPGEEAPFKVKCGSCPQYHNGCESEVMVLAF